MNKAFMAKLGWILTTEQDKLWVSVVRGKYTRGELDITKLKKKGSAINAWRGIASTADIIRKRARISIGSGRDTLLWRDIWVGDQPLITQAQRTVPFRDSYSNIREYWSQEAGWK